MEEANYDDDDDEGEPAKDAEDDNENDEKEETEKGGTAPVAKAQPKQGARKKRRGGRNRGKAKQKAEQQAQDEDKNTADTIGRTILTAKMKKTRMCDFHKDGRCKYGSDCAFAHDESELQSAPDLRKTRLCRSFVAGKCDDADCKFAHGEEELRASDICFKTALCTWFEKGTCQSGSQCRFAHGEQELRDDPEAKAAARARKRAGGGGERGAKRSRASSGAPEPLCHRCGSTIATALGYSVCAICRC